jgi:dTDP-4-dehydrorhamnose 3,5-epimerase
MGKFKFSTTSLSGLYQIEPTAFGDERGFFMEFYNAVDFAQQGLEDPFVQDNHSRSQAGVLRGLHFQSPPHAQGKLVRVLRGEIFDVAVDIRQDSATFGKWHGEILSAENRRMLFIPPGFAHGFLSLTDGTEVLYKCTEVYHPESERGIIWNDPAIGIKWPVEKVKVVLLSDKDRVLPQLKDV